MLTVKQALNMTSPISHVLLFVGCVMWLLRENYQIMIGVNLGHCQKWATTSVYKHVNERISLGMQKARATWGFCAERGGGDCWWHLYCSVMIMGKKSPCLIIICNVKWHQWGIYKRNKENTIFLEFCLNRSYPALNLFCESLAQIPFTEMRIIVLGGQGGHRSSRSGHNRNNWNINNTTSNCGHNINKFQMSAYVNISGSSPSILCTSGTCM